MEKHVSEITNIVGQKNVSLGFQKDQDISVYGSSPRIIVSPTQVEQLAETVKYCSVNNLQVLPFGNGTKLKLGNKPKKIDIGISTRNLNRVIDHNGSDLIITVEAGITLNELQQSTGKLNQFLPIDPPHIEEGATIGGIASTNDSGPSRLRYGTLRELILEVKVLKSSGELIKGGAKVVKNVAGYDLPKLFIGSLGTLGIITECSLRLFPIPEHSRTYVSGFSNVEELKKSISEILQSNLVLTCLEVANSDLSVEIFKQAGLRPIPFPYTALIKIDNVEQAVNDQIKLIQKTLNKKGIDGAVIEKDHKIWEHVRNFPFNDKKNLVCKASLAISDIYKVLEYIEEISNNLGVKIESSARTGNGIIIVSIVGENKVIAANLLRSYINSIKGSLVILQIPEDTDEEINVWGDFGSSKDIMKTIKQSFDPNNILNPGRLL